jgi:hypothetical protein
VLQEYLERGWMTGYGKGRDEGWTEAVEESERATATWKEEYEAYTHEEYK